MDNTNTTFVAQSRGEFADAIRAARSTGTFKVFGRLGRFGRVLVVRAGLSEYSPCELRMYYPAATPKPHANIHRAA